jgi:CelD/BcsL family acetyltransferase involved in cellulose biosynthesis
MTFVAPPQNAVSAFIAQHTAEPFYYQPAWLTLLSRLYSYPVHTLQTTDADGALTGLMPVMAVRSPLTGRRVVSLPFSDCCPPLASSDAAANALVDQALALAQAERARYLEVRSGALAALDARPDLTRNDLYSRWVVPLERDTQAMWKRVKSSSQQPVKKARKEGVIVRVGASLADVDAYHHLHLLTRSRKHGMPAQPARYFRDLWQTFNDTDPATGQVRLLLAEHAGVVIAGMILLISGSTVRYAYSASDQRFLRLGPNNALMWEAISWASEQGYARFDMGRTAHDNAGLVGFKRSWGALEEPLPYYYYPQIAGLASTSEESWKYRLLTGGWRRLPLPVAEALGGVLYRHLG